MNYLIFVFLLVVPTCWSQGTASIVNDVRLRKAYRIQHQDPKRSLNLTKQAARSAKATKDLNGMASSNFLLGQIFYTNGAYSQSIRHYHKALRQYIILGRESKTAEVHSALGTAYYFSRQSPLALHQQELALRIYREQKDSTGIARTFTRIGHLREKEGNSDQALHLHMKALRYCKNITDSTLFSEIYENIGSVYEDKTNYPLALHYYQKACTLNARMHAKDAMNINLNNLGDCYRKMGQYEAARHYTNRAISLARTSGNRYEERSALRDLYKLFTLEKQYEKASLYLDSAYTLSEELYSDASAQQIALLGSFHELEQKDREIELLNKNKRNAQLKAWIYLLTGLLALLLLFAVIWRMRIRIKTDLRNLKAQEQILATQHKLMQVEIDNSKLRESKLSSDLQNHFLLEKELQQELQLRSQALSSHTLQLIEKNSLLENLQGALQKALKADGTEKNKLLREVSKQIDFSFHRDRDWSNFEDFFAQVHTSFYDQLKQHLPDITRTEQRLCALIKLKLESKQIATILGITVDSLRIARYRLKKRFKLDESDSLGSFIELL